MNRTFSFVLDQKYLALGIILVYPAWRLLIHILTPKPLPGIPYREVCQYPVIGDAVDIGKHQQGTGRITDWFDTVADELMRKPENKGKGICQVMFGLSNAGRILILTDWKEGEDLMIRRAGEFDRAALARGVFPNVTPTGPLALVADATWKHHRRVIGPAMTSKNVASFFPRADRAAKLLVELWRKKAKIVGESAGSGQVEPFNAKRDFMYALTDAIFDVTYGESSGCVENSSRQIAAKPPQLNELGGYDFYVEELEFFVAAERLVHNMPCKSAFPNIVLFFQRFQPSHLRDKKRVTDFMRRKIAEGRATARERGDDKRDLADNVLDLMCLKDGGLDSMPESEMQDELFTFVLAGAETTQGTLCHWVKRHARNPESQRKLRKELVDLGLLDRDIVWDDLAPENTPYLSAVVHETLRTANTAGGILRSAMRDTTLLGHFVPKGVAVYLPISLYNDYWSENLEATAPESARHKAKVSEPMRYWNRNPSLYQPERWLDGDGKFNPDAGPCRPFGFGQRGCFGKNLALVELKLFIARCVLAFFFERVEDDLDSNAWTEHLTRMPVQVYIKPVTWTAS